MSGLNVQDIKNNINTKISQDHGKQVRYICVVGNWEEVPIYKVLSPEGVSDDDEYCFTDALYGCPSDYDESNIFSAIPSYLVGRIPTTNSSVVKKVLFERADEAPKSCESRDPAMITGIVRMGTRSTGVERPLRAFKIMWFALAARPPKR